MSVVLFHVNKNVSLFIDRLIVIVSVTLATTLS